MRTSEQEWTSKQNCLNSPSASTSNSNTLGEFLQWTLTSKTGHKSSLSSEFVNCPSVPDQWRTKVENKINVLLDEILSCYGRLGLTKCLPWETCHPIIFPHSQWIMTKGYSWQEPTCGDYSGSGRTFKVKKWEKECMGPWRTKPPQQSRLRHLYLNCTLKSPRDLW